MTLVSPVLRFVAVLAAWSALTSWAASAAPPNVIIVLVDDLGCYGSVFYETPNIDRLSAAGMRFTWPARSLRSGISA